MLLHVYRKICNIRGFSRETLVALVANTESQEWRREFSSKNGIPPEHPRTNTTDDVECFFSLLRDNVTCVFTYNSNFLFVKFNLF